MGGKIAGLVAAIVALSSAGAQAAAPRNGYVHLGYVGIIPEPTEVEMLIAGAPLAGADFDSSSEAGFVGEVGWYFAEPFAISASLTSSVLTKNTGTGSLSAVPDLASDSFMLGALTTHYHFQVFDRFRPYLGAGIGWFHPTGAYDGAVINLSVDEAFGPVLQLGADFDVYDRWGVFVDIKQFFMNIDATGTFGGSPISASAAIDPFTWSVGVSFRF